METWSTSLVKNLLFAFNLLFAISGVAVIAVGAVVLADVTQHGTFVEDRAVGPPIVLIVAGCAVLVIAGLGCCGAARESKTMLYAFAVALLVVFILELAAGIAAAVYRSDVEHALRAQLKSSMANYTHSSSARDSWNSAQKMLHCCGVDGPNDWLGEHGETKGLPESCCHATREGADPPTEAQCKVAKPTDIFVWQDGCAMELQKKLKSSATVLIGVGIGVAFIQILGIVLACWLAASIGRERGGSAADK